jgi:lysophospholipase L1-like esterase
MAKPMLKVVVLGDSAMWGQGLLEKDKYSTKSVEELGKLLGRQAQIVINSARSGAVILAGRNPKEAAQERKDFVNIFPHLFASDDTLKEKFIQSIEGDSQDVALNLHHENPASFPTVEKQVQRVPESVAQETELVLLNGGANDLDFEEFLNPSVHRENFVKHYDRQLKDITFVRVKLLLRQTRKKFPKAVIVYTGYFAPFAPGISSDAMKELFEHLSREPRWKITLFSNSVLDPKDVDQLVLEAQLRSQFGVARGLYWTRKAIAEANADPKFRGPGLLFIHPQFGPENTVFASNSFFHHLSSAYGMYSRRYFDTRNYKRTIECLNRALELAHDHPDAHFWRGLSYYWSGDYDNAIADITHFLLSNPNDARAIFSRQVPQR